MWDSCAGRIVLFWRHCRTLQEGYGTDRYGVAARIDSIIRLVALAGRRHGGDFGFGTGAGTFLLNVADCA